MKEERARKDQERKKEKKCVMAREREREKRELVVVVEPHIVSLLLVACLLAGWAIYYYVSFNLEFNITHTHSDTFYQEGGGGRILKQTALLFFFFFPFFLGPWLCNRDARSHSLVDGLWDFVTLEGLLGTAVLDAMEEPRHAKVSVV